MKNRISIVIPTLNEEENIKSCLNHLLNQKEKTFEVIVVDNGSSDNTLKIADSLKSSFQKKGIILKTFYHPIGNQTNARDLGTRKSSGEIIGSLDAEALAEKNWISKINEYMKDENIVAIGGKSYFRNRKGFFNFFYTINYYLRLFLGFYCIGGGNSAFRKKAFLKVNGYKGLEEIRKKEKMIFAKDDYFLSKKLEKIGKVKFCKDLNVSLLYRVRDKKTRTYKKTGKIQDILKRAYLEIVYDYKISKYINDKKY